jgi:hypothetical protein
VLVSEEFQNSKKFFPETEEQRTQIVLADVPYLRLRDKLSFLGQNPHASFTELVSIAQREIDELLSLPSLVFEPLTCTVRIGEKTIKFQPFDFAFYLFCVKQRKPILAGKRFSEANWRRLRKLYSKIAPSVGQKLRVEKSMSGKDRERLLTKSASTVRRVLRQAIGEKLAKYYAITSNGKYGQVRYTVPLDRSKIVVRKAVE